MRLETPEKIRDLQRKLYLKAKKEPKLRFIYCRTKYGVKMFCSTLIAWFALTEEPRASTG